MDMSWGAIHKATTEGRSPGEHGEVTQPHPSGGASMHHEVDYNATDGRHNRENGMSMWPSIDHQSGPTSDTDFGSRHGSFPDGPGVWRQT